MTSTQLLALTSELIENEIEKSGPLLIWADALLKLKGDPVGEVLISDVRKFLYSQTEHSEQGQAAFISEAESDSSPLAA